MPRTNAVPLFIAGLIALALIALALPVSQAEASSRHSHHHGVKVAHGSAPAQPAHRLTEAEAQSFQAHEQARRQERDISSIHP
jgi:hypothetical protein